MTIVCQDYSELKESFILFICKHDPFKNETEKHYGLPCYTFRNICIENNTVNLNDKSLKVIYNAGAYREEKDEKIRSFLKFVHTNEPGKDDFSNRLSSIVEKLKENEKFRSDYLAMNLHDRDITRAAKKEGIAEGALQKAIEAAKNLWTNGVSLEIIAKSLNMTTEQVNEIVTQAALRNRE